MLYFPYVDSAKLRGQKIMGGLVPSNYLVSVHLFAIQPVLNFQYFLNSDIGRFDQERKVAT